MKASGGVEPRRESAGDSTLTAGLNPAARLAGQPGLHQAPRAKPFRRVGGKLGAALLAATDIGHDGSPR